jgi:hypothetical protein
MRRVGQNEVRLLREANEALDALHVPLAPLAHLLRFGTVLDACRVLLPVRHEVRGPVVARVQCVEADALGIRAVLDDLHRHGDKPAASTSISGSSDKRPTRSGARNG